MMPNVKGLLCNGDSTLAITTTGTLLLRSVCLCYNYVTYENSVTTRLLHNSTYLYTSCVLFRGYVSIISTVYLII